MRILTADDDAISRTALAEMLKKHGHEVLVTVNGAQAWQAMQQPGAPRLVDHARTAWRRGVPPPSPIPSRNCATSYSGCCNDR
ncbi:MAG: response regulator [bacterium]|nr:response regulator [bacterium]